MKKKANNISIRPKKINTHRTNFKIFHNMMKLLLNDLWLNWKCAMTRSIQNSLQHSITFSWAFMASLWGQKVQGTQGMEIYSYQVISFYICEHRYFRIPYMDINSYQVISSYICGCKYFRIPYIHNYQVISFCIYDHKSFRILFCLFCGVHWVSICLYFLLFIS